MSRPIVTTISPNLMFKGMNFGWPKTPINGNGGGGVPYGEIHSRHETPSEVYGRFSKSPRKIEGGYQDRPKTREQNIYRRAIKRILQQMENAARRGYWANGEGRQPNAREFSMHAEQPAMTNMFMMQQRMWRPNGGK